MGWSSGSYSASKSPCWMGANAKSGLPNETGKYFGDVEYQFNCWIWLRFRDNPGHREVAGAMWRTGVLKVCFFSKFGAFTLKTCRCHEEGR